MATKTRDMSGWESTMAAPIAKITWRVEGNPKRPHGKAHERFENYFGSATVQDYLDAGGTRGDLRYDWQHQFLDIEVPPKVEVKVAATGETEPETKAVASVEAEPKTNHRKGFKLAEAQTADDVVNAILS